MAKITPVLSEEEISYLKNPDNEQGIIEIVKSKLISEEQKAMLAERDLTIADCLNGRYGGADEPLIEKMYLDWNRKAGAALFGGPQTEVFS